MNKEEREGLKKKILTRQKMYAFQHSRIKRALRYPFRTIPYYFMSFIAYRRPFKVNYETLWGDRMQFYLPEGSAIYHYGFFEANLTNFFINYLMEGDVFIDIGAHVGFYSLLASKLVGLEGQVHSFEPTPRTFASLQKNATMRKNISINNYAVMDCEKTISFMDYGPKYSAFNSFKVRNASEEMKFLGEPKKVEVRTISIDAYCKQKNIKPTVVKIDAEGAEHIILKAMDHILDIDKPVVTIEVAGGEEWRENCKKSIDILLSKSYLPYEATTEGMLRKHVVQETYHYDNLIFVHKDAETDRIKSLILKS